VAKTAAEGTKQCSNIFLKLLWKPLYPPSWNSSLVPVSTETHLHRTIPSFQQELQTRWYATLPSIALNCM